MSDREQRRDRDEGRDGAGSRRDPEVSSKGERLVAVLGVILVVALLCFLAYQALAGAEGGPELTVDVGRIERAEDQFVVHVRVRNDGGKTAQSVSVSGALTDGGRTLEQATTTVSYVPPTSFRDAALVFTRDPREVKLNVRAAGYELP